MYNFQMKGRNVRPPAEADPTQSPRSDMAWHGMALVSQFVSGAHRHLEGEASRGEAWRGSLASISVVLLCISRALYSTLLKCAVLCCAALYSLHKSGCAA